MKFSALTYCGSTNSIDMRDTLGICFKTGKQIPAARLAASRYQLKFVDTMLGVRQ